MGNLLSGYRKRSKRQNSTATGRDSGSISRGAPSSHSFSYVDNPFDKLPHRDQKHPSFASTAASDSAAKSRAGGMSSSSGSAVDKKKKYGYIPDSFTSIDQVQIALRESGLESSNLILGVDFTKSNEWTGINKKGLSYFGKYIQPTPILLPIDILEDFTKPLSLSFRLFGNILADELVVVVLVSLVPSVVPIPVMFLGLFTSGKVSFNNRSLHAVGDTPNPYEKAISIIGKTLAPFDEDNLIPCFGFGDATTHDQDVFSFHSDHSPCHGFEEVLACYKRISPNLRLSGPTSYGPVVDAAVDIVEKSGGQYHVLVIIADGQVTRSVNMNDAELSPQEERTINSIVNASLYPLSIVLIGVGDGPWEDMKKFDDKIPAREFDNFQFVNFTAIMSKNTSSSEKETAFALAALMEIPIQYKATKEFGILGRVTGKAKKIVPRPPPVPYTGQGRFSEHGPSNVSAAAQDDRNQVCPVCLTNGKDMAFGCGHMTCRDCSPRLSECPICRQRITNRLRLYT